MRSNKPPAANIKPVRTPSVPPVYRPTANPRGPAPPPSVLRPAAVAVPPRFSPPIQRSAQRPAPAVVQASACFGLVGAGGGALIGAAVGSLVPVIGTAGGAIAGGAVGGLIGYSLPGQLASGTPATPPPVVPLAPSKKKQHATVRRVAVVDPLAEIYAENKPAMKKKEKENATYDAAKAVYDALEAWLTVSEKYRIEGFVTNRDETGVVSISSLGAGKTYHNAEGFLPAGHTYTEHQVNVAVGNAGNFRLITPDGGAVANITKWFTSGGTHGHANAFWRAWDSVQGEWARWDPAAHTATRFAASVGLGPMPPRLTAVQRKTLRDGVSDLTMDFFNQVLTKGRAPLKPSGNYCA